MRNILFCIIGFLVFPSSLFCQGVIELERDYLGNFADTTVVILSDIDRDGVLDSMYYDYQQSSLIYSLSTQGGKQNIYPFPLEGYSRVIFTLNEDLLCIEDFGMRFFLIDCYRFDTTVNDFRLTSTSGEYLGPASNDGSGSSHIDFETHEYTERLSYYDPEIGELLNLPAVEEYIEHPPVYLNGEVGLDLPDFFTLYKTEDIIKKRMENISGKDLVTYFAYNPGLRPDENVSLDSLFTLYGKNMNYTPERVFTIRENAEDTYYLYTCHIIPIYHDPDYFEGLLAFKFDDTGTVYITYKYNKKDSSSTYEQVTPH